MSIEQKWKAVMHTELCLVLLATGYPEAWLALYNGKCLHMGAYVAGRMAVIVWD